MSAVPPEDAAVDARIRALHDLVARSADQRIVGVLDRAAAGLLDVLDEVGVVALLLKGPALARLLYRPGEHRDYIDVDVMVAPRNLGPARRALAGLGYENVSERAGVDDFLGVLHSDTWVGPLGVCVDLHWRLAGCERDPEAAWARLSEQPAVVEIAGRPAYVLGRPAMALHLATHAAQGDLTGQDGVLAESKTLGDLRRGLERWPLDDWEAAARLAADVGAMQAFSAGLRRLPEGTTLSHRLGLPASDEMDWAIRNSQHRPRGTFHVRALTETPGWRARADLLRRSLLPRRAWIAAQMPWTQRSRPALLTGYVLHCLRLPLWAARAWRYDRRARRAGRRATIDRTTHGS